jgi:Flp pilus assembly protein TadG
MRTKGSRRREAGSAAVEAVILLPVIMVFVLLAAALGRFETARTDLIGLAREGAEAASVMPSSAQAVRAANLVGQSGTSGIGEVCPKIAVGTNTAKFVPGGYVDVTLTCEVDLASLGAPGLSGRQEVTVHQLAPIDPYRAVSP